MTDDPLQPAPPRLTPDFEPSPRPVEAPGFKPVDVPTRLSISQRIGLWWVGRKLARGVEKMPASWRTFVSGVATILVAIAGAAKAMLDGDPSTNPDWTLVIAAITSGFGLIKAKDHNVTGGTIPNK